MTKKNLGMTLKRKSCQGVTLIEVVVVVFIISFLILAIIIFLRTQIFKASDARRKAEIKRIGIAVEEYEKDKNCYPLPSLVICKPGTGLLPYLDKIPCDPTSDASYLYEHEDSLCPKWYRIYAISENESGSFVYTSPNAPSLASDTGTDEDEGSGDDGGGGDVGETLPLIDFYGCISGVCTSISWDPTRPGPSCDPNYQNPSCYGQCANPANECQQWN